MHDAQQPQERQGAGGKTDALNRPKYATIKNPTIEAIIGEHFRFANPEQAQNRLEALREAFIISKLPAEVDGSPLELKLWIRGYGLSAESREAGYIGNYARFEVKQADKGKWTIAPVLLNVDKRYHPQRRQTAKRHPNWGHPIMRDIQKGRVHKTVEGAQNELTRLHEAFPEVSIPLTNKMYIMAYQKVENEGDAPIRKWVLEIKALDAGGFHIVAAPNTYQADTKAKIENTKKTHTNAASAAPKQGEAVGRFTSQVLLKQSKKKAKTPSFKPKVDDE
jgi:hypothetical protein